MQTNTETEFQEILEECDRYDPRNVQAMIAFEENLYIQDNLLCGK